MIDDSNIDFLWEYFEKQTSKDGQDIFYQLQLGMTVQSRILDYLRNRFDIDDEGRPNEEMRLANSITFEEDRAYSSEQVASRREDAS